MTLKLPTTVSDPEVQQNLDVIARQFPVQPSNVGNGFLRLAAGGNHKVNWGQSTVTFTASQFSAIQSVSHGVGSNPTGIFALPVNGVIDFYVTTSEASAFGIQGFSPGGVTTGTFSFYWLALV